MLIFQVLQGMMRNSLSNSHGSKMGSSSTPEHLSHGYHPHPIYTFDRTHKKYTHTAFNRHDFETGYVAVKSFDLLFQQFIHYTNARINKRSEVEKSRLVALLQFPFV